MVVSGIWDLGGIVLMGRDNLLLIGFLVNQLSLHNFNKQTLFNTLNIFTC